MCRGWALPLHLRACGERNPKTVETCDLTWLVTCESIVVQPTTRANEQALLLLRVGGGELLSCAYSMASDETSDGARAATEADAPAPSEPEHTQDRCNLTEWEADLVWITQQRALCRGRRSGPCGPRRSDAAVDVDPVGVVGRVLRLAVSSRSDVSFAAGRALTDVLIYATRHCTVAELERMVSVKSHTRAMPSLTCIGIRTVHVAYCSHRMHCADALGGARVVLLCATTVTSPCRSD
jgi:hypothetical protein